MHTKPPAARTWRRGRESRDGGCRKQVGVAGCGLPGAHTGQGRGGICQETSRGGKLSNGSDHTQWARVNAGSM